MTIQQFIEKAIEGGWGGYHSFRSFNGQWVCVNLNEKTWLRDERNEQDIEVHVTKAFRLAEILLDPEAWKAVGKVEGWYSSYDEVPDHETDMPLCWCQPKNSAMNGYTLTVHHDPTWRGHWHAMIDALAEGKTIEQFIETL